jgi:hypothetical protein
VAIAEKHRLAGEVVHNRYTDVGQVIEKIDQHAAPPLTAKLIARFKAVKELIGTVSNS